VAARPRTVASSQADSEGSIPFTRCTTKTTTRAGVLQWSPTPVPGGGLHFTAAVVSLVVQLRARERMPVCNSVAHPDSARSWLGHLPRVRLTRQPNRRRNRTSAASGPVSSQRRRACPTPALLIYPWS